MKSSKKSNRLVVHMIGNAHIDPVWLWPWQAGVDEALASFRSAADRCEEYPEFIYTRGEAWLYEQVERIDPVLFQRVLKLVERGQWHITGGQYVQPDANLPSHLGWIKQLQRGTTYFKNRFGVRPRVGYNVDTFGHPATLPDILAAEGFNSYVFHRPTTKQMDLAAQTFIWKGANGGEVLAHRIGPAYTTRTDNLHGQIMMVAEGADPGIGHVMCFYGVGNHGGGPTKGNIEYILNNRLAFDGLELRFSNPEIFFNEIRKKRATLPVITDELQHTQPGCYSVMHDIKQAQRYSEHRLGQCEQVIQLWSKTKPERTTAMERLKTAWDDLLFTQFHDILAGTSIPTAWEGVRAMQGRAKLIADELILETTRRWARQNLPAINHQQIAILNPGPDVWDDYVEWEPFLDFQRWGDRWLSDEKGNPLDFQMIQPEAAVPFSLRTVLRVKVPAQSAKIVLIRDDKRPARTTKSSAKTDLIASTSKLGNSQIQVSLSSKGIGSIRWQGEQILSNKGITLQLRKDGTDTWTLHTDKFTEAVTDSLSGLRWTVEESGPIRSRVRARGQLGQSPVEWTLGLLSNDPRVFLDLEIDFREKLSMLQMPVHLNQVTEWHAGLAGGSVVRQPEPVEWPVLGWSKVRDGKNECALVTQDAYSLSLQKNIWQWTLLRSPKMAWGGTDPLMYCGRDYHTDQGIHRFRFVLQVGKKLTDENLSQAARQLAEPPIMFDRYEGMNRPAWGENPPRYLWTGAEQRAREDGHLPELVESDVKGIEE